jgi:hypothetical protein
MNGKLFQALKKRQKILREIKKFLKIGKKQMSV